MKKGQKRKKKVQEIIHDPNSSHDMLLTDEEYWNFQVEAFLKIPIEIREKAIEVIRGIVKPEDSERISSEIIADPVNWLLPYNLGWGAKVRNLLRRKVCNDTELPTGSWNEAFGIIAAQAILNKTEDEILKGW